MPWRIVPVSEEDATPDDLTSGELLGISVFLTQKMDATDWDRPSVLGRARAKIQPQVQLCIEDGDL
jgi:hypothetical protein